MIKTIGELRDAIKDYKDDDFIYVLDHLVCKPFEIGTRTIIDEENRRTQSVLVLIGQDS